MRSSRMTFAALCLAALATATNAAVDVDADIPPNADLQLIVVEAAGCAYCGNFRRDILPVFEASKRAKQLPVRFLDVNDLEAAGVELDAPVELVPTFVLAQRGKEVGRVPGYVGLDAFFKAISHLLLMTD